MKGQKADRVYYGQPHSICRSYRSIVISTDSRPIVGRRSVDISLYYRSTFGDIPDGTTYGKHDSGKPENHQ